MPCQSGERPSCSRIRARVSSWVGALDKQEEHDEFCESELVVEEEAYDREWETGLLLLLLISGMERGG